MCLLRAGAAVQGCVGLAAIIPLLFIRWRPFLPSLKLFQPTPQGGLHFSRPQPG